MSITQAVTSVGTSATEVCDASDGRKRAFLLTNLDTTKTMYIGTSSVTTSAYGTTLGPGEKIALELDSHDKVYACVASGTANIGVLGSGNRSA